MTSPRLCQPLLTANGQKAQHGENPIQQIPEEVRQDSFEEVSEIQNGSPVKAICQTVGEEPVLV